MTEETTTPAERRDRAQSAFYGLATVVLALTFPAIVVGAYVLVYRLWSGTW